MTVFVLHFLHVKSLCEDRDYLLHKYAREGRSCHLTSGPGIRYRLPVFALFLYPGGLGHIQSLY
jgi:hypothetical protein